MRSHIRRQRLLSAIVGLALVGAYAWARRDTITMPAGGSATPAVATDAIAAAYRERASDVQVQGVGVVRRVLPDDDDGSRHLRFILALADGQTVLVAHNIDLAPRLTSLDRGDTVAFFGEYEWNADGGVIHWTHHDPARRHVAGWLKHEGRTVQ